MVIGQQKIVILQMKKTCSIMIKTKLLLLGVIFLAASCSSDFELTPDTPVPSKSVNNFNTKIDPTHTWNMTSVRTLTVTNLTSDFTTKSVMILDANPFTCDSAQILASTENVSESITYEAPTACTTLYAACVNGDKMRVRAFNAEQGTVDFSTDQLTVKTSSSSARRAAASLTYEKSLNAYLFEDKGWNDELAQVEPGDETVSFTNFTEYSQTFVAFLPENQNNHRLLESYDNILSCYKAIVTKANGEVKAIPVHLHSGNAQSLGYFYYLPGESHDIKTVKKYYFPEIKSVTETDVVTQQAYRLQYFDEEGNASYQFPAGTEIYFFLHVNQKAKNIWSESGTNYMDWYSEGASNYDLHTAMKAKGKGGSLDGWEDFTHVVMFERNGEMFIGMEDWNKDFDYNDIVFMIRGDVADFPTSDSPVPSKSHSYTYAFEDTYEGDYDLNDVVLQVSRIWGTNKQKVTLAAIGGWDRLFAYYKDASGNVTALFGGKELHELMGVPQESFVNTETYNVTENLPTDQITFNYSTFLYSTADFYIVNETKGVEVHIPTAIGAVGSNPYGVCVPYAWKWSKERVNILNSYSRFSNFAADQQKDTDWYTSPVAGKIME